ncbi:Proton-coupled amino acid transporter 1 [Fragariocoptes setiger]|uniref:Proton-coupled amino acid transporter 1 n=1 Tax=Fragariocoptes setiger TaxID=1670756 RepID=A0ABQ7S683_9ACAR|nr:Proton-coupled amino acid transporter 1 [Fragariocoptes setiger]
MKSSSKDRTNFGQSLMHLIKCNLGTGLLAMPAAFANCGLIYAFIGLPVLAIIATYCVHLLIKSAQYLESKIDSDNIEYAELAKSSFKVGPSWMRRCSGFMCKMVDATLIISQMGICCVYLVFIVDNVSKVLSTYNIHLPQMVLFGAALPVTLLLSYIRTLKKLSIASACANVLQVIGILIILEFLVRDLNHAHKRDHTQPLDKVALGFGSAMFAFEGISVVMPVYTRMKQPDRMRGLFGAINLSYFILFCLYFSMGAFGYLRFGNDAQGSITLNLPANSDFYNVVRIMFTMSILLTYPLQFYVPNEIIWNWAKENLIEHDEKSPPKKMVYYEYYCRTILVLITFILAVSVPELELLMGLVGSISGTMLSIILPPIIHLAAYWENTTGQAKLFMCIIDFSLIIAGVVAASTGSFVSLDKIVHTFFESTPHHHQTVGSSTMTTSAMPASTSTF